MDMNQIQEDFLAIIQAGEAAVLDSAHDIATSEIELVFPELTTEQREQIEIAQLEIDIQTIVEEIIEEDVEDIEIIVVEEQGNEMLNEFVDALVHEVSTGRFNTNIDTLEIIDLSLERPFSSEENDSSFDVYFNASKYRDLSIFSTDEIQDMRTVSSDPDEPFQSPPVPPGPDGRPDDGGEIIIASANMQPPIVMENVLIEEDDGIPGLEDKGEDAGGGGGKVGVGGGKGGFGGLLDAKAGAEAEELGDAALQAMII